MNVYYKKYTSPKTLESNDIDNWIIGFINGLGCFYINKTKLNIEHTDRLALEIIKRKIRVWSCRKDQGGGYRKGKKIKRIYKEMGNIYK